MTDSEIKTYYISMVFIGLLERPSDSQQTIDLFHVVAQDNDLVWC